MLRTPRLHDPALDRALERDGYAVLEGFLTPDEIAHIADVFRKHDSPLHRAPFAASVLSGDVGYRTAVDRELKTVLRPKIDTIFNGYRHCFSNFVVKAPQPATSSPAAGEVLLHQDITFVDEDRFQSLGIWAPLIDTDTANGCLFTVPGSQQLNHGPRGVGTAHPYRHLDAQFRPFLRAEPMRAGSLMIFCQKLFHASLPNRSSATRVVVGGLFVPREAQLYCYYADPAQPSKLQRYEVDDLFYTRYPYGSVPTGVRREADVAYWFDPITPAKLARAS